MKAIAGALVVLLFLTPVLAETIEATAPASQEVRQQANCLAEFDITFWQTLPFAGLWSYFIASQLAGGGAVNWGHIAYFSLAAATINAALQAKKTSAAHSR
jgi:hypothetical protein